MKIQSGSDAFHCSFEIYEAVQKATAEKDKELRSLQERVMELEQQLTDYQRYKAYFEAEFLLRHGREVMAV